MKKFLAFAAVAALASLTTPLVAQNPAVGAQAPRRMTQGGSGPVRMLLVTKAHAYERDPTMRCSIRWAPISRGCMSTIRPPKPS